MRRFAGPLLLLTLAAGLGCSRAHDREDNLAIGQPPAPAAVSVPIINVPAEVGKTIDELRQRLGPPQALPAGFQDPMMLHQTRLIDSTLAFRQRGLTLVVNYDARSRQVLDLLVLGGDENALMRRAGLLTDAATYVLLPVFDVQRPTQLLGLRVVPRS